MPDESRPPFAASFPRDEELDRLVDAFANGNFASVRTGAPKLAETTSSDAVRAAAKELLSRTKPDPLALLLLALTAALLVVLSAYWIVNGKPPPNNPPVRPPAARSSSGP